MTNGCDEDKVLIVPANKAIRDYNLYSAYICQPKRSFQSISRLAFYYDNHIDPIIPQILGYIDELDVTKATIKPENIVVGKGAQEELERRITDIIRCLHENQDPRAQEGKLFKILILSDRADERTEWLFYSITNDKKDWKGRGIPFAQSHRYASLDALKSARCTSDIE